MNDYLLDLAKYVGVLVAFATIADFIVPRKIGDEFSVVLVNLIGTIKTNEIDRFANKVSGFWL